MYAWLNHNRKQKQKMRTEQIEKKNQNKATEKSVFQALNINGTCKKKHNDK